MNRTPAAASSTGPRAAATPPVVHATVPSRRTLTWVIAVITLVAAGLRLFWLSRPGFLFGITEYDDGTDFGSAIRLVYGSLPYHGFIMVQPPGITWLMAPVALATKGAGSAAGMAAGRVVTALASAAAVPLAGLLTRHRGLVTTIIGCGLLAVYPDSLAAAKTVLLEPWLVLFCLLGALAVFDRDQLAGQWRLLLGGLAFGFAGAVKVWAILPVAVVIVLAARPARRAAVFAAGVLAGFALTVLPFAAGAPVTFYRSVVVAQLIRSDLVRIPAGYRLQQMLGLIHAPELPTPVLVILSLLLTGAVVAVTVAASRLGQRRPSPLDWFALITCALIAAAFLWPADFYYHYPAFLAPFLALAIALPAGRLLAVLPDRPGWAEPRRMRRAAPAAAAGAVALLACLQAGSEARQVAQVPDSEISQAEETIPPGACVLTDQVSYTIAINRFVSPVPGCSLMVDGLGADYALSGGQNGETGAGQTPAVERLWMSGLRAAQYVWLNQQAFRRVPWTPQLSAYFNANFVPLTEGPDWLYVRRIPATPQPSAAGGD